MALQVIPQTEASVLADTTPSPFDRQVKVGADAHLGFGLLRPFRRDEKNDFANGGSLELIQACVGQILGMQGASSDNPAVDGELEWAPKRGSLLYLLRHQKNDLALRELARIYVVDALRRFEPRIRVKTVLASREKSDTGEEVVLLIRIKYDVISVNTPTNQVLFADVTQDVRLAA